MLKKCSKCGIEKELTEFNKCSGKKDGLYSYCKKCAKERNEKYYYINRKEILNHQKVYETTESRKKSKSKYYYNNKQKILKQMSKYLLNKMKTNPDFKQTVDSRRYVTFILKPYILDRDNFQCQLCFSKDKLIIHHILPVQHDLDDKNILNPKNLVTLCHNCHKKAHNYNWKSLNLQLAQQLLTLIRTKEDIKPTILPKYDPEELAS